MNRVKKFCTNCGTELKEGKSFCTSCGAAIKATTASQVKPKTKSEDTKEVPDSQGDASATPAKQTPVSKTAKAPKTEVFAQEPTSGSESQNKKPTAKIALAAALGVFAAILVATILGFAMPESSLGRAVTGIFSQEEQVTVAEEDAIYESVEEVRYEDTDTVEEATVEEVVYYEPATEPPPTLGEFTGRYDEVPDSEFLQQSLAEIRAIGDTGDAGAIGRLAADFNANNAQRSTVLEREADRILRELDNIEAWILEYAAPSQARDNQLDLIALCRTRVIAIQRAMQWDMPGGDRRQSQYLDEGRDARIAYEHILAEGDLY